MKRSDRLLARLRNDVLGYHVPNGATIRRTYAGHRQREQGAWSWYIVDGDGRELVPAVGSAETVGELLAADTLTTWGDYRGYIEVGTLTG